MNVKHSDLHVELPHNQVDQYRPWRAPAITYRMCDARLRSYSGGLDDVTDELAADELSLDRAQGNVDFREATRWGQPLAHSRFTEVHVCLRLMKLVNRALSTSAPFTSSRLRFGASYVVRNTALGLPRFFY